MFQNHHNHAEGGQKLQWRIDVLCCCFRHETEALVGKTASLFSTFIIKDNYNNPQLTNAQK